MITPSITPELQSFLLKTKQQSPSLEPLYFTHGKSTLSNLFPNLLPQNPDKLPSFELAEEKVALKPFPPEKALTFIKNTDLEAKPDYLKKFVLPDQPPAAPTDSTNILATARGIYNKFISQTEPTPNLIKEITATFAKTAFQQHKLMDHLKTELFAGRALSCKEYCRTASISLSMYYAQQADEQRQYAIANAMANTAEAQEKLSSVAAPKLPPKQTQLIPAKYSYAQFRLSLFSQAQQAAEDKEYELIDHDQHTNVNPQSGMQCRIM